MGRGGDDTKMNKLTLSFIYSRGLIEVPPISSFYLTGLQQRGGELMLFLCYTAQETEVLHLPDLWAQMGQTS